MSMLCFRVSLNRMRWPHQETVRMTRSPHPHPLLQDQTRPRPLWVTEQDRSDRHVFRRANHAFDGFSTENSFAHHFLFYYHLQTYTVLVHKTSSPITFFWIIFFKQLDCPIGISSTGNLGCSSSGKPAVTDLRYPTYSVCWVFECFHNPPNSDMATGSLTCTQVLMHAVAYGGVQTP